MHTRMRSISLFDILPLTFVGLFSWLSNVGDWWKLVPSFLDLAKTALISMEKIKLQTEGWPRCPK